MEKLAVIYNQELPEVDGYFQGEMCTPRNTTELLRYVM